MPDKLNNTLIRSGELTLHGFRFKYSVYKLSEGIKAKIRLIDPRPGKTVALKINEKTVAAQKRLHDEISIDANMQRCAKDLLWRAKDALIELVRTDEWTTITLEQYFSLQKDRIHEICRWAGSAEQKVELWKSKICPAIGQMPLLKLEKDAVQAAIPELTLSKRTHNRIGEMERELRILLYEICKTAVTDKVLRYNPLESYNLTNRRIGDVAARNLGICSLTQDQTKELLRACDDIQEENLRTAMKLNILTILSEEEICGLNLNSFESASYSTDLNTVKVSWLEIVRTYEYNEKRKISILYEVLKNLNLYRRYPCSWQLDLLLRDHIRQRKRAGASKTDPMFANVERLTPEEMKTARKELLEKIGLKPGTNAENGLYVYRQDLLWKNANYHLRHDTGLDENEIQVLDGATRPDVYAKHYVGWSHPLVLRRLAAETERWHSRLFADNVAADPNVTFFSSFSLHCDAGSQLQLSSAQGFSAKVEYIGTEAQSA